MHDHMNSQEIRDAGNALITWFETQEICMYDAVNIMMIVMATALWELTNHDRGRANDMAENIQDTLKKYNQQSLTNELRKFFDD